MYPPQTSFIPLQVALARFLEGGGLRAVFKIYPYWYLGVPYRYLSGPILVPLSVILHRLLPCLSLFGIFFLLIALGFLVGVYGVYFLVKELSGKERVAFWSAFFYAFFPIIPFLFRFSDGLSLISFSVLPYVLVLYFKFLKRKVTKTDIKLVVLMSFLLLLDISILPVLVLSMVALFLARADWKKAEERIKKSLSLIVCSLLIVTLWYTPGYWLRVLGAPSLAGKGVASVVAMIGQLLPVALAISLAVLSIKFFKKKDLLRDFAFYFLFVFGFLTLMRFIADPDFWLDWSAYGLQLQLGIGIALGYMINQKLNIKNQNDPSKISGEIHGAGILKFKNFSILICGFTFYILIFGFIFNRYVLGTLQRDLSQTVEYKVGKELSEIAKPGERPVESPNGDCGVKVFLSGTTAFWLNSLFDIPQVRGGKDEVAPHPSWDQNVWEIRDGTIPEKTLKALKELGVSYLVVHTERSAEFYHDFTYPEKFEEINKLEKIYEESGDIIYRVLD